MGRHISSVAPGNTVDSYITTSPVFIFLATISEALFSEEKSGCLFSLTGVGTVIMKILHSPR